MYAHRIFKVFIRKKMSSYSELKLEENSVQLKSEAVTIA